MYPIIRRDPAGSDIGISLSEQFSYWADGRDDDEINDECGGKADSACDSDEE